MCKLADKVAVVTGASKGIGAKIARELAAAGASVVVNYATSRDSADKVVGGIARSGGKAVAKEEDAPISAVHRTAMEQLESTQGVILLPQRLSRITGDISGIGRGLLRYTEFGRRSDNCIVIAE